MDVAVSLSTCLKSDQMKILIADDHWIVRESIKHVFKRIQEEPETFEAANFTEANRILEENPDIALMVIDLIMPGFDEFAGLVQLRIAFPNIPIVVISVHEDREFIIQSITHGVVGYIPKSSTGAEIERALSHVLEGDVYFPRDILARITRNSLPTMESVDHGPTRSRPLPFTSIDGDVAKLTARETEILELLGQGLSDTRIAKSLDVSPNTVRVHISKLMSKLGLTDRAQTIHYAVNLVINMKGTSIS